MSITIPRPPEGKVRITHQNNATLEINLRVGNKPKPGKDGKPARDTRTVHTFRWGAACDVEVAAENPEIPSPTLDIDEQMFKEHLAHHPFFQKCMKDRVLVFVGG